MALAPPRVQLAIIVLVVGTLAAVIAVASIFGTRASSGSSPADAGITTTTSNENNATPIDPAATDNNDTVVIDGSTNNPTTTTATTQQQPPEEEQSGNSLNEDDDNNNNTPNIFDGENNDSDTNAASATITGTCPSRDDEENEVVMHDPWEPISSDERGFVRALLQERLGLEFRTRNNNPSNDPGVLESDRIVAYDLDEPNKNQTLAYLDDASPQPPDRYARATVMFGSSGPRYLMVYRVGPLPVVPPPNNNGDAVVFDNSTVLIQNITSLPLPPQTTMTLRNNIITAVREFTNHPLVRVFLQEAFGDTRTLYWSTHDSGLFRNRTESVHVSWRRSNIDNILAYPLPLACVVDIVPPPTDGDGSSSGSSTTPSWNVTLHSILYRDQFFATRAGFLAALEEDGGGGVEIVPTTDLFLDENNMNPEWQTLNQRDDPTIPRGWMNYAPPATNIQPAAPARYTVRRVGGGSSSGGSRLVEWLGWSFWVVNRPTTSLALYNIVFKGTRIAYEISNQELLAVYTGNTPHMANKYLFDSAFRYGSNNRDLRVGVDCPGDATVYFGNTCVFEHDGGIPLWRKDHRRWYAGASGTRLVVRSMFEVGNYDYLVEVKFQSDGSIDAGFGATGQLFMSYYMPNEEPFGTRVHTEALANLHTHYAAFKVDLDILEDNNTNNNDNNCVEREEIVYTPRDEIVRNDGATTAATTTTATNNNNHLFPRRGMSIVRTLIENETQGRVRMNHSRPTNWKIVSCNETNRWGYLRGYEIVHPNTALPVYHHPGFSRYHTVFARRKETEPYLTQMPLDFMARAEPFLPVVGDDAVENAISNGESLVGTDVVAWVSLGFYHLPRAEDNPVTNTIASHFTLRPFNYFDENPSLDLGQTVRTRDGVAEDSIPRGDCTVAV